MIRTKNPHTSDGGSFSPTNRPPVDQLTPTFRTLFAEYDELSGQLGRAESELRDLVVNWSAYAEVARRSDGVATAESGRTGTATVITTAADELRDKKRVLEDRVAALRAALPIVLDDLADERTRVQGDVTPLVKAEDKARARLTKALDEAEAAARALTTTIATREWITDHTPWEAEPLLDIKTVWAPANRLLLDQQAKEPVRVADVINALKEI